jgi:hypothetical protein
MVVMQGGIIVHRGAKLKEIFDRITIVNGYVSLDTISYDPSRFSDIKVVDQTIFYFLIGHVIRHG